MHDLTSDGMEAWARAVLDRYGLTMRHMNDLYLDIRRGFIMAGSEYVCRVGDDVNDPSQATEWTPSIGAFVADGTIREFEAAQADDEQVRHALRIGSPWYDSEHPGA